ncbi:diacylglycerol/lipid kinase family protein [Tengunoibacter tsumagoiensis]|uniref:Diacylglycerol kinase n=1 Tax=Tengunoibacter tsumagoiensis TaxID=2014871 RepID=A0A402A0V0_9CHLR|nr:diacylglycerol kinase family protein [Tengunoibacter tsumagoiensis]GCE12743.1 diacylglycerol kinase [Tengunoibacter tsumagoiensis]
MPDLLGKPVVLLNPTANRGKMQPYRHLLQQRAEQEGADYYETRQQGEAREKAREAALSGRPVIIAGGDGSVNEVVNGLLQAGKSVPLGIVAAGSGNDFAWNALQLPKDPQQAIERAFTGQLQDVDAGIVNGAYFVNSFSVGLDADIAAAADELKKVPFLSGKRLYYASILRQLLFGYHRCPWLTFSLDGAPPIYTQERHYVFIAATNGPSYGAGFRVNPQADISDGWLDICTVDYLPLLRALTLLSVIQKGHHAGLPEVHMYRAKKLQIESNVPVYFGLDGETRQATKLEIELLPAALQIRR